MERAGTILAALAAVLALAGCLPDKGETLGDAPTGINVLASYDFTSGGVPSEFSQSGTVATPLYIESGQGGGVSGAPSLAVSGSTTVGATDRQCITPNLPTIYAEQISFYRRIVNTSDGALYNLVAQPSGTTLESAAAPNAQWTEGEFDVSMDNQYTWCTETPTADGDPLQIYLDDIVLSD